MAENFNEIDVVRIADNPFKLIGSDWMLITAGNESDFNTMTASWGAFGELWNKKVTFCFIRPTRHTYGFIEQSDIYTLSFFDSKYREALKYCGTYSGRDVDKMAETGLTPVASPEGSVYFEEARLVIECRKIYTCDLEPDRFLDAEIDKHYTRTDYHRMYVGEVVRCLSR